MTKRTYGQYCAVARTLDLVGERWTLLIVRELIGGPKRYSDLLDALPGIGTSLLAQRLKQLETDDIVRRKRLPPPAASTVYELTPVGDDLATSLLPLALWGARHLLGPRRRGETFRAEWPLLVVRALLDPAQTVNVHTLYEFRIDGEIGHVRIDDGRVTVHHGEAPEVPDVTMTVDLETFVGIGVGRIDPGGAMANGHLVVEGKPEAVRLFLKLMPAVG